MLRSFGVGVLLITAVAALFPAGWPATASCRPAEPAGNGGIPVIDPETSIAASRDSAYGAGGQRNNSRLRPEVTVYLDNGAVTAKEMAYAERLAGYMFAAGGIRVVWAGPSLKDASGPAVRLHIVDRQADRGDDELGYARPYATGARPVVIMFGRLKSRAGSLPGLAPKLLAHVIVHEITHILQGTDSHSDAGVMKARWTADDYREMLWNRMSFTKGDISLIRSGLARSWSLARADAGAH